MTNYSKIMFFSIMVLGTMLTLSAESWLGMWMGLELNMASFIPLIYKEKMNSTYESCMIYFLIQSMGSIIMLISVLMNSSSVNSPFVGEELFSTILAFSMMMKMGAPPFHFWFPEIMEKMSWPGCFILMTWQKIAPMYILSCVINMNEVISYFMIPIMVLTGSIGGLNQTSIRKIMSYSSMDHMGWMIACMKFSNNMWIFYFAIYSLILATIVFTFWFYSAYHMNQYSDKNLSFMEKIMIVIAFLSLGGLPPFLGFLPKLIVIQLTTIYNSHLISIILVLTTLITLFYYLRLISSIFLINNSTVKWSASVSMNNVPMSFIITVNSLFPLMAIYWL
uniref:NADH-ubiquinone oxidoreductase chain 2 n=1 Tax=Agriosphodrus dohrni TaxID=184613 RepID=G0WK33_AGRDO|nr:NADH dehydrogenase subunit 2 [Agriosphodrus dohrni]ADF65631.1 NADH dehydrogenase subunit 2 [Agriosphodrus dohrni]